MKKLFILIFTSYMMLSCSSTDSFMVSAGEGYKPFKNEMIGFEFSTPENISIQTRTFPVEGTQEQILVNFSMPIDPYNSKQEINVFSSEISDKTFDFNQNNEKNFIDYIVNQFDEVDGEIIESEYIFMNDKKIGFYKHLFTDLDPISQISNDSFSYDIFEVYFIFDPIERKSFYVKCTVTKTTLKEAGWDYKNASEKCQNIIRSVKPI